MEEDRAGDHPLVIPADTRLLRVKDVAVILNLPPSHVYRMVRAGQIPGVIRVGQTVFIRPSDFWPWAVEK